MIFQTVDDSFPHVVARRDRKQLEDSLRRALRPVRHARALELPG